MAEYSWFWGVDP